MARWNSSEYTHSTARVLISVLFLVSGTGKLGAVKPTQEYMEAYGVPGYLIWPAAALEIQGGLMLVLGLGLRSVGMILSGWCLLTGMIFHRDLTDQTQQIMFMKNLAMAGGLLVLADISVDKWPSISWERLRSSRSRVRDLCQCADLSADIMTRTRFMKEMEISDMVKWLSTRRRVFSIGDDLYVQC